MQLAADQRIIQRRFINDFAARGIDQDRAGLHPRHRLGIDHAACDLGQRHVQRNHIAAVSNSSSVTGVARNDFSVAMSARRMS